MNHKAYRRKRQGREIKQWDAAKCAGITPPQLCAWEKGHIKLSDDVVSKLVRALDVLSRKPAHDAMTAQTQAAETA